VHNENRAVMYNYVCFGLRSLLRDRLWVLKDGKKYFVCPWIYTLTGQLDREQSVMNRVNCGQITERDMQNGALLNSIILAFVK
jgi:hypothetical protein